MSTTESSELYSQTDILMVQRLEAAEQARRNLDTEGEQQKKNTAFLVSAMVEASFRPTWLQQGSTYVSDLLKVAREKGNVILTSASQAKTQAEELGQRGIETANDFKHKIEVAGTRSIETAQDVASDAKSKSFETAHDVKLKLEEVTDTISKKTIETAQDVRIKVQETLESAQGAALEVKQNIQASAQQGLEKVQGVASRLRGLSLNLVDRVSQAWDGITFNAAFVKLEEETERIRRMNSETESTAILNAFRVSALIKELTPEFYNVTAEPSRWYLIKLLEDSEQSRRIKFDASDALAKTTSSAVAKLINAKNEIKTFPAAAKAQIVEPITVTRPLIATM